MCSSFCGIQNKTPMCWSNIRSMAAWERLLSSPPEVTSWTAINSLHQHTNTSEIQASKHLKEGKWEEWREKSREGATAAASPQAGAHGSRERGGIRLQGRVSTAPSVPAWVIRIQWLANQPINWIISANAEVHSCVLAAPIARQKTKPKSPAAFPHPPRASRLPQEKLQQWVSGYRAEYLQPWEHERETQTWANPSDEGGYRGEAAEV